MCAATGPGAAPSLEAVPIADASLAVLYTSMPPPQRQALRACVSGWCLDGMDFLIYPLVIGTIIKV